MSSFFGFLDTLVWVGFAALAGSLVFFAYACRQPRDNPLRVIAGALASRVATTVGIGMLDMPLTLVEPLGSVADMASLGFLAWYWWTGLRQMHLAMNDMSGARPPGGGMLPR